MQGIAEVVPVSSSAQLSLLPWLLGWPAADDRTGFAAGLHAGSCVGIGWALRHDLRALDTRTAGLLAATTVPAALAGATLADAVERRLGRPGPTAALLALAGLVLWRADLAPGTRPVGPRAAAVASLAQVLALAPGVSRSGATLTALRSCGVDRDDAIRFSLLMSLPVTAGAAVLSLARTRRPAPGVLLGAPVAALAGAVVTDSVRRRGAAVAPVAALYRVGLAAAVAVRLGQQRRTRR